MSSDCNERPDGFEPTTCLVDNHPCEGQGTDAQCEMCQAIQFSEDLRRKHEPEHDAG